MEKLGHCGEAVTLWRGWVNFQKLIHNAVSSDTGRIVGGCLDAGGKCGAWTQIASGAPRVEEGARMACHPPICV